jgi:transcriptional regulator EpsA
LSLKLIRISSIKKVGRTTIITPLNNTDPPLSNDISLNQEQQIVFMEVISESLRISQRSHLFNWLQGGFQYLLGHEIMICGVKTSDIDSYDYEFLTSSRYFNEIQFNAAIKQDTGIVSQALNTWKKTALPLFVNNQVKSAEHNGYSVLRFDEAVLKESELLSLVAHGFGDSHSKISTFVVFARLSKQPNVNYAHILELLMPHLHCALIRVASNRGSTIATPDKTAKKITGREIEVLQWMHMGKTNWEISTILNVSPLTIKNHVQNILRKLDVQNRGQAAIKASKLGLVKAFK